MIPNLLFADAYQAQVGDEIMIFVLGQPEFKQTVKVRPDGMISYFGKDIKVKGETTDEIRYRVYDHLTQQGLLKNPIIMLTVTSTQDIFVGGAVRLPGRYPLNSQQEIGLQRAIALAGGMLETGDFHKVQVIRRDQTIETLDLSPGTDYHYVAVQSGDLVFVPTLAQVEVQGQVQTPSKILIRQRIRIDHALTRAGGPIYDEADLSKLVIGKSNGHQIEIEVSEQFWKDLNKDENESYYLQNGDVLYVPNAYKVDRIYVLGYVHQPGAHKIRAPITIQQAVALAGGSTEKANRTEVIIRRPNGQVEQVALGDDNDSKILIHPGDSVEIPKKFDVNWSLIFSFISVSSVAISILSRR
ncbi:TPA: hypothetical protein EYO77_09995 [Candidatus Poribacteria bacterium]|nr:hypothetical protein [Candidatus Poribacteria bacterium]